MAYSLAHFKFKKSLEREIRNYWIIATNSEISGDWLKNLDPSSMLSSATPKRAPYTYVELRCSDLIKHLPTAVEYARENALVNFITSFEVYMFEMMARLIYLEPELLGKSEVKFDVKDIIVGLGEKNIKHWFSNKITDKTIRNNQHSTIIEKIAKLAKCDLVSIRDDIDEWDKWTYVRNAIVHTGRRVSTDLFNVWKERFFSVGVKLSITNAEIMKLQALAARIAKQLDARANETVIQYHDAHLLVRELFIRNGLDNITQLKKILQKNISYKITREEIEKIISIQKKLGGDTSEVDFDSFLQDMTL